MAIELKLSAANMGDVTEADFDAWTAFLAERIEDRTGLVVEVDQYSFSGAGAWSEDSVKGADPDEREAVQRAVQDLWNEFCETPSAWPSEAA